MLSSDDPEEERGIHADRGAMTMLMRVLLGGCGPELGLFLEVG